MPRVHEITLHRRRLGLAPISNRPLYGYRVVCSCGFEERINGNKRAATRAGNEHKRAEKGNGP